MFWRLLCFWFAILTLTTPGHAVDIIPRPVFQNGHYRQPDNFAFSHDGKTLASLEQNPDTLILRDVASGDLVAKYDLYAAANMLRDTKGRRVDTTLVFSAINFSSDDKIVTLNAVFDDGNYDRVPSRDLVIDIAAGNMRWSDVFSLSNTKAAADLAKMFAQSERLNEPGIVVRNPNGKGCVAVLQYPQLYPDCDVLQKLGPRGINVSGKGYPLLTDFKFSPFDVAASPSGLHIAIQRERRVDSADQTVGVFDVRSGRLRELPDILFHEAEMTWTPNNLLAVLPRRWDYPSTIGEQSEDKDIVLPSLLLIDPDTLQIVSKALSRCRNILAGDTLIGFGGPDCSQPATGTMWRNALDGRDWVPLAFHLPNDEVLVDMQLLRGGRTLLITSMRAESYLQYDRLGRTDIQRIVDARSGAIVPQNDAMFDADSHVRDEWLPVPPPSPAGLGRVYASGQLTQLGAGWSQASDYALHFWRAADFAPLLDFYLIGDKGYLVTSPYGTYDTNLGPDTPLFRWTMTDDPRRSLAPQTFMRDYFEPKLMERRLLCTVPDNCATVFRPLPPIASLNRTLPETVIDKVTAGAAPDTVNVTVTIRGSENREAVNGKTLSGVHDLRVFRNGQLVAQFPKQPLDGALPADLAGWASATRLVETGKGGLTITLPVRLKHGENSAEFTACAFNNDRVKGETTGFSYVRDGSAVTPQLPARQPRAVVLTFGFDTNGNADWERWRLGYAASDARSMAKALSVIPGYGVETIALTSTGVADNRATKAIMRAVLLALSDNAGVAEQAILRDAGIPAASLAPLRPDDMLIISWSGHGVTLDNQFYLVPADAIAGDTGAPQPDTMISAADLSRWLGAVDATDMALIIDACHSAASVDDGRFKPGPMGDPGLGQLAFDKGIRILAASQANALALEFGRIGHGLLSYALFHDGLNGPTADSNGDGKVLIGEWLSWGVTRVPGLAVELTGRAVAAPPVTGRGLIDEGAPPRRRVTVQQPALFDFNNSLGPTLLQR